MKHFFVLVVGFLVLTRTGAGQTLTNGQAARLIIGQSNFTISQEGAQDILIGAAGGLAWVNNNLFVVDSNRFNAVPVNNRVLIFPTSSFPQPPDQINGPSPEGYNCFVCVGRASVVLGQTNFNNNFIATTQSGMSDPTAVASDGVHLAVADTNNNRIMIWNSIPTQINQPADVVVGQANFTQNAIGIPPTATSLRGPQGVWIQNGKLFVADTLDNRVLIWNSIPTKNGAAADVVVGQPSFTTPVPPSLGLVNATATNMTSPISVTSDGIRMFVTDLAANRILMYNSIPTSNGVAADYAIGQPDLTSSTLNNAKFLCNSTGNDTNNNPVFPARCAKTLSFPRYALSNGTDLFVADGGNDRVLAFALSEIGTGQAAYKILGQPDENTDNPSDNADAMYTPGALAWDGTNLYVADTFNRRVLAYSTGFGALPQSSIRNAFSLEVYAIGTVTIAGVITAKDTVTVTIGAPDSSGNAVTKDYTYTIVAGNTLDDVVIGLVALINASPGDPNVTAQPNLTQEQIVLTSKVGGDLGTLITLATSTSTSATITATASGGNLTLNLEDASKVAPGSLVSVFGTNLSDGSATGAPDSNGYYPTELANTQLYLNGLQAPLLSVSPSQINAQMPYPVSDTTSVSAFVRTVRTDGSINYTSPSAVSIVEANPGILAEPGTDPRPGYVYHAFTNSTGAVSVDGTITAGDVGSITIADQTFTYTVTATDTLATIVNAFVTMINADENSPATAQPSNTFTRILLVAKVPGPDSNGITYSAKVTTGTSLILTALTPALCCASLGGQVSADNPAVPGEIVYIFATGLGLTTNGIPTGQVATPDNNDQPVIPIDSILAGGSTANLLFTNYAVGLIGTFKVQFQLNSSIPTNSQTQLTIAQQSFVSNVVTFPVVAPAAQ